MKQKAILFSLSLIFLALATTFDFFVVRAEGEERIKNFKSEITIEKNSEVKVTEEISYFFSEARHGIFRFIPYKYQIEKKPNEITNYKVNLKFISAEESRDGSSWEAVPYSVSSENNDQKIRIGREDQTVEGDRFYRISYSIQNVITYQPPENKNQDEFFWNVTGNKWQVPIDKTEVTVNFPNEIDSSTWSFGCFTGYLGSQEKECSFEAIGKSKVKFESKWPLEAGQGLSVVSGIPQGLIEKPDLTQSFWFILKYNLMYYAFLILPLAVAIAMMTLWFFKGRDPKGKETIVPFYGAPENLSPVEIGTLFDEKADPKDFSSSIINLAVKGYLKIKEIEKKPLFGIFKNRPNYQIIFLKRNDLPPGVEREIYSIILGLGAQSSVTLEQLQNAFPPKIATLRDLAYDGLVRKGYFPKSPQKVRNTYFLIGFIFIIIGVVFVSDPFGFIGAGSVVLSGLLIMIFGYFMPQKTIKGVNAYEKILGLKEYLEVAEKDRINFHNAPAKRPELFEKLLPYAMILGVERAWAKQFESIYTQNPSWYEGTGNLNTFNTLYFVNSLSAFSEVTNLAMGTKNEGGVAAGGGSGFGGGGFSGGGFGGGGGGSW